MLVALLRKEASAIERLEQEALKGTRLSTTPINICELYDGANRSRNPAEELSKVDTLVGLLDILPFNIDACEIYGEKTNTEPLRSKPIGDFDLMIACIAIAHKEPLATRNKEHFGRVGGLAALQW